MRTIRFLILSTIVLASLSLMACTGDSELSGSAADLKQPEAASENPEAGDPSESTKGELPVASAKAILDAIASIKSDTIDLKMLGEAATQQELTAELDELELFLQRISGGDLGSGRIAENPAFVKVAEALTSGKSASTRDLRELLQAISKGS